MTEMATRYWQLSVLFSSTVGRLVHSKRTYCMQNCVLGFGASELVRIPRLSAFLFH